MQPSRHFSLDALRGFAVMGILVMNIISFALPRAAYINPLAWGIDGAADIWAWAVAFVVIEGKMRGLFSVLFGASMLLVIQRAQASGQPSQKVHFTRMAWLLIFGITHYALIWDGDILALYALCGILAYPLRNMAPRSLLATGALLMLANTALWLFVMWTAHLLSADAVGTSATAGQNGFAQMMDALGAPGSPSVGRDLAVYRDDYTPITALRISEMLSSPFYGLFAYGAETVGLMAWGMALLKSGWLTGQKSLTALRTAIVRCYLVGLPFSGALAWICWSSGFDALTTADVYYVANSPARLAVMLGHLFALLFIIQAARPGFWMQRIAAAGRMAFSNYILTSILMTFVFYGYGLGLFGTLSRAESYLAVGPVWIIMLVWSKPWLDRFRYGPLEWAWRSLARRHWQPMLIRQG